MYRLSLQTPQSRSLRSPGCMDALRKAAAVVGTLDQRVRQQAREQAEKQLADGDARRRAAALMAPSASTAASAHAGGGTAWTGVETSPAPGQGVLGTPLASGRRRPASPASLLDADAGATPAAAASALADVYGGLEELQRAALSTPATPPHYGAPQPPFDVAALADMLRIDIVTRCALHRGHGIAFATCQRAAIGRAS